MPADKQYRSCISSKSRLILVLLLSALPALQSSTAQNSTLTPAATNPAQCPVRVIANEELVSSNDWYEVAHHVLPAGIVENPDQWPYFAWSDTPLGIVRSRDDSDYLFFGSDGGDHPFDGSLTERAGSITLTKGTLDHPLGEPASDPNPSPTEFLLPKSANLPATMDYVGGGPAYRVPQGEPGAGSLLIVYHAERNANPFWSWTGLAKSTDEGQSWQDLGLIISGPRPYDSNGALDIGDGTLVAATDPTTQQKYFYVFFPQHCWINSTTFCSDFTYLSVARAPYENLLTAVFMDSTSVPGLFHKYYNGQWNHPGMGGKASELFSNVTGQTDGDPQVAWSAYRNRFVATMDNGQYIAYGESTDGLNWPPMQVIWGKNPQTPVYGYANAIGSGADPSILDDTFYSYYTEWPTGVSWQPATINRLTITTASTVKTTLPSSATAGGPPFTLTVTGNHFAENSLVTWNGSSRPTIYASSTQLTAQISASDIAVPRQANVGVWTPRPCGGNSDSVPFTVSASTN